MYGKMQDYLSQTLAEIKEAGLYKEERLIESAQQAAITVKGKEVLNFCANNYLGLSDDERLIEAAKQAMDRRGFGMSSVRFICGCQDIHKELEKAIAEAPFQTPVCPIYQNVDAKPYTDPAAIKANLIAQLTAPVRWTYIVKNMLADGVTEFTELGPGNVLQGLIKKVNPEAVVESKSTL